MPMTREQWLGVAAVRLSRTVRAVTGGAEPPENIRFSVGFPKRKRGRGANSPSAGVYSIHASGESTGGFREVFIAPTIGDADAAGAAVLAALIEAATQAAGRRAVAVDSAQTAAAARGALGGMPEYPHDAMVSAAHLGSASGSRLIKASCPACGYTIRLTRKWIAAGLPICPQDGTQFTVAAVADDGAPE